MQQKYGVMIQRLEQIVAELECEFLYLLNDLYADSDEQTGQMQSLVAHLRLARCYLASAASDAQHARAAVN